MFCAIIYTPLGKSQVSYGLTPERAIEWANDDIDAPSSYTEKRLTYRPADGVIFRDGVPCGVVFKGKALPHAEDT